MVANCMSFVFLKNIDKQSCTVYLEIKLLKSIMTANKYVKTKVWHEFYKTRKKVIVRHLNPTKEDEKNFFLDRSNQDSQSKIFDKERFHIDSKILLIKKIRTQL